MTVAVLLMAAVPGHQRLAAQEAGGQVPGVEQAGGKQGGVMQLTLEGAMDLACSQSVDAAVALNQLKSTVLCRHSTITTMPTRIRTALTVMCGATGWASAGSCQ